MRKAIRQRRGVASIWLLVMIVLITSVSALVASEILKSRELANKRESELRAEWLARGALEYGLRQLGDNPKAGTAEIPADSAAAGKASVAWKPGDNGTWNLRAEAIAGQIPALKRCAFTMPAIRKGGVWIPAGPVERVLGSIPR